MKVSRLIGSRTKETPQDCQTANHIFMVRGGYIRNVAAGIFSLYNPMRRVTQKIERIIREEMDAIDGQEVLFPVVMPATLWQASGRYDAIGSEMARFTDRNGAKNVLGMTHEEASVHLVRDVAQSYQNYPFMIYQIQTKFRDEPRSRGGLMRVREFTMKDAYSFHTDWYDLTEYYNRCLQAYRRIFARAGLADVAVVQADSGMMGGSISHEFMYLSPIGEDKIIKCPFCDFISNLEAAETIVRQTSRPEMPLTKIHTPDIKTIRALGDSLGLQDDSLMKAVVYSRVADGTPIVVFVRGDMEVSETKLRNHIGTDIVPYEETGTHSGIVAGFIGAVGLDSGITCVLDRSLQGATNLVGGANEIDYHISGISMARDLPNAVYADVAKAVEDGICPACRKEGLGITGGVEVGNIFQLGDKYTKAMKMQYLDNAGELQYPIMGCYGIGVGRLAASVLEEHHDDYGPIWPIEIAPWHVAICALNIKTDAVKTAADALYQSLAESGIEVLYDDREVSAGVMFSDADLLGCPLRLVVSPKTLARGAIEVIARDKSYKADLDFDATKTNEIAAWVTKWIAEARKQTREQVKKQANLQPNSGE